MLHSACQPQWACCLPLLMGVCPTLPHPASIPALQPARQYSVLVVPADGFGTGRARLSTDAPRTFAFLKRQVCAKAPNCWSRSLSSLRTTTCCSEQSRTPLLSVLPAAPASSGAQLHTPCAAAGGVRQSLQPSLPPQAGDHDRAWWEVLELMKSQVDADVVSTRPAGQPAAGATARGVQR